MAVDETSFGFSRVKSAPAGAGASTVGIYRKRNFGSSISITTWLSFSSPSSHVPVAIMTESAFSSSAQAVIQRPVVLDNNNETRERLSAEQFSDYYELEWTANEIIAKNYKRVSGPPSPSRCDHDELRTACRLPSNFRTNFCRTPSQSIIT